MQSLLFPPGDDESKRAGGRRKPGGFYWSARYATVKDSVDRFEALTPAPDGTVAAILRLTQAAGGQGVVPLNQTG